MTTLTINGAPVAVVPKHKLEALTAVIMQHAVARTPETFESLRNMARQIHREAAPEMYDDPEPATDPALTAAVVEMREALEAVEAEWVNLYVACGGGRSAAEQSAKEDQFLCRVRAALARVEVSR